MDDLVTFIEQRLTEDELWAKAASAQPSYYTDERPVPATGVHWTWAVGDNWTPYRVDPLEEFIGESVGDYAPSLVTVEEWPTTYGPPGRMSATKVLSNCEEVATGVGAHIARHDPARVLREVEAKRRLLAAHPIEYSKVSDFTDCATCLDVDTYDAYPCLTLRLVALPYADHPDFRPEWAVDHG